MSTTLLTFLGRLSKGGYQKTCYDFGGGERTEPVAFFGWPLQKRIGADRMVIMGTSGSMWDHLLEGDISLGEQAEEIRLQIIEATEKQRVTPALLAPLETPLSELLGCEVRLVVIPYCRDQREQIELIRVMSRYVERGDIVQIDITHGFRHLPLLAVLAALYLQAVRKAEIGGIWYGSFDSETGEAPVHNLVGILRIADWIRALYTYDKDGDYGVFADLLGPAGHLLTRAAFFERTTNPVKAREALSSWTSREDRFSAQDPAAELFREELEGRIRWYRGSNRPRWERDLSRRYLEQRDYVRALIYALEATVSLEVIRAGKDPHNFKQRREAKERLLDSGREELVALNRLRNAVVHGTRPNTRDLRKTLEDESSLRGEVESLLARLVDPQLDPS